MYDNNEQSRHIRVRISRAKIAGIFVLISVLVIIMGLIIYDKQLVEPDVFAMSGMIIVIILSTIYLFIWNLIKKLDDAYNKIELMAITDGLTQLFNKNHFNDLFKNELSRAIRHERNLSCIVLDIDSFMKIIDKYGHQFGNEVLQDTAEVIKDNSRISDIVARYDRDKFISLLPETEIESAMILAKRLRRLVEGETFSFGENNETIPVTICIGATSYKPSMGKDIDIYNLMDIADKALKIAKEKGRNSVEYLISE
ncbi:MAG: GGDEF domain-containing protein [Gammaproteobacteria bacterium]